MLIDTHCHLDFADFAEERDAIIARAHEAGVKQMVTISTRVRKLDGLLAITEAYPSVFCSVGTHPNNAGEELDIQTEDLVRLANAHEKIVAIGEAGLDYVYDTQTPAAQTTGLIRQFAAAATGIDTFRPSTDPAVQGPLNHAKGLIRGVSKDWAATRLVAPKSIA